MGRHSAPDDLEDGDVLVTSAVVIDPPRPGRHARPDDDEEIEHGGPPGTALHVVAVASPVPKPQPSGQVAKGNQSTAADLELLRTRSDVRARVIAAVIAPFVIYTLAMYLIGATGVYFIWVWLPLVTAGVLAGSILDAAHRKRARGAAGG